MQITLAGVVVDVETEQDDAYSLAAGGHALALDGYADIVRGLPPNPVIFDVGANMGLSVMAAAIARPDATIIGFEPGPKTVQRLRRNVAAYSKAEIVYAAVSDKPGLLRFHTADYSAGAHVVSAGHMVDDIHSVEVPAITLDSFTIERGLRPTFIKIDVEGHEPEVLAGARELIAAASPLIYLEFNSWTLNAFAGHSPAAFAKALFRTFDIEGRTDPLGFLHDNLLKEGCVSDLKMRLKAGAVVPSLPEMSGFSELAVKIDVLKGQLNAIERSTSWKATAAMRNVMDMVRARRATRTSRSR